MTISATTQGIKPGVCLSTNKPANPFDGQVIYMTDVDQTAVWDGTQWTVLAPIAGGRNVVTNGGMDVWQRGTSFANASASPYYTVDRFQTYRATGNTGLTVSRQTSALDGFAYALRAQRDSGNTSLTDIIVAQSFETQNVRRNHNKVLTLSFYARCGSNFSSASSYLGCAITTGTGTDGSIANGFTGQTDSAFANAVLTTTFQRFTLTLSSALPTSKTQLAVRFAYTPVGTAGANDWFEITGVQLEAGAVATPFEFEDYGITLTKCQRYYYRQLSGNAKAIGVGYYISSTQVETVIGFPTTMRTAPSAVVASGTDFYAWETNSIGDGFNVLEIARGSENSGVLYAFQNVSGTEFRAGRMLTNNAGASIAFSAEL